MSDALRKLKMNALPPMPPSVMEYRGGAAAGKKRGPIRRRDYTPVTWDKYFQRMHDVKVDSNNVFRVYERGSSGPVCFFLHGGGFSALSWALLSSVLSEEVECRCVAVDLRGHGDTQTEKEDDLSAEQLSRDVGDVVSTMYGEEPPPIILIGHSMGGAIAVHTAQRDLVPSLIGLVVIDVVEGTALDALSSMQSFLMTRPKTFKSVEFAVEWCVRSGQVRNLESAKVSMVGQVKRLSTNETATSELSHDDVPMPPDNTILEEDEEGSSASQTTQTSTPGASSSQSQSQSPDFKHPAESSTENKHQYTWRIDLSKTEKFWRGWFEGLSSMFLSCDVPKVLLLAGVDRLDRDLTLGQMQGKFQMQVLPQSGHAVHEDVPEKVADVLATFMVRNKFAESKSDFHKVFPSC